MKNTKKNNCIYCGTIADTLDHVPSRNLTKILNNVVPIKVPSCRRCNISFSKDEEFFRNWVVGLNYGSSLSASHLFDTSITRSIKEKPALANNMFKQMNLVDLYSGKGVYLGKRTSIKISDKDYKRISNVLNKYIKGLFYHHFNVPVPDGWSVEHELLTPDRIKSLNCRIRQFKWEIVNESVFLYGYNTLLKTHESAWCLVFFQNPLSLSFILNPATIKQFKPA